MSDGPNLSEVMRGRAGASGAVFTAETFGSLHPDGGAIFCCSDAREEAGNKLLNLQGKQAFPFPVPGTAWPPFDKVDRLRKAMLALALEKGASEFRMAVHSDCGAAELGLRYPEPHLAPNARIAAIVDDTAQTVDNLPQVSKMMLTISEGDMQVAKILMARHIGVLSLHNLSGYFDVGDRVIKKELDLSLYFHDLKPNTGKPATLEHFDPEFGRWIEVKDGDTLLHMCRRRNDCGDCISCGDTVKKSLELAPLQVFNSERGELVTVHVPRHLKDLIEERRAEFQPETHKYLEANPHLKAEHSSASDWQPMKFVPRQQENTFEPASP